MPLSSSPPKVARPRVAVVALLILSAPFWVFALWMLSIPGLVELRCAPSGPCTLETASWLSRDRGTPFAVSELKGARVEQGRSSRKGAASIYRAQLQLLQGERPLSFRWNESDQEARAQVEAVERYLASHPRTEPLFLHSDGRAASASVGLSFLAAGLLVLSLAFWVGLKARGRRLPAA